MGYRRRDHAGLTYLNVGGEPLEKFWSDPGLNVIKRSRKGYQRRGLAGLTPKILGESMQSSRTMTPHRINYRITVFYAPAAKQRLRSTRMQREMPGPVLRIHLRGPAISCTPIKVPIVFILIPLGMSWMNRPQDIPPPRMRSLMLRQSPWVRRMETSTIPIRTGARQQGVIHPGHLKCNQSLPLLHPLGRLDVHEPLHIRHQSRGGQGGCTCIS